MRYRYFIAAIIAFFAATSCYVDDMDQTMIPSAGRDEITVVGRVARFEDRVVDTRGTKDDAEAKVTCMAVAIFPIVDGAIGDCVFYDFREGSQLLFTINRQEMKNGAYIYNVDKPYVMYVFANLPTMTEEACANKSLDEMKAMAYSVESVKVPTNGFPMVGSLGDTIDTDNDKKGDKTITPEGDGKTFILKPGSASNPTLPLVNGEESDLLNVPMKAMFAKVNFTIKVTPDQTVDIHLTPQFTLNSYSVHNVPASVDFAMGGKPRLNHSVTDNVTSVIGPFVDPMPLVNDIKIARGTQTINFTFYLPERYLTPTYQSHDGSKDGQTGYYNYPFPVVSGKYRDEDLNLRQRFKPLLPDGQAATYVTINGTFRDHQQHEFDVTYDIYLGEDNYGNFDTERNCEYYHYVTIRGILNSDDQVAYDPNKEMPVAIDHRVNVNRVEPIIINLRRETLLDSHFEVRPLRIRKNPDYKGDLSNAKVKVEVVYDKTPAQNQNWIGLERSFGNGVQSGSATHLADYLVGTDLATDRQNSLGKRKYFTTDLTTNTLAGESQKDANGYSTTGGQSVIVPITAEDEAVWIYVDEALVADAGDATRKATIRVSVAEDGENYGTPIDYVIQQRQLFPVTYGDHTYLIEYEEEYLHNFDASDSYGQTEYEGMKWGLEGDYISSEYPAYNNSGFIGGIITYLANISTKYDFYLPRDASSAPSGITMHPYAGYDFSNRIVKAANIGKLHLASTPGSAVEYCYNRNKRIADGTVSTINWYLPAIDEIEEICKGGYSTFLDFQGKFYWSSQPAYKAYDLHYYYVGSWSSAHKEDVIMQDNPDRARATKVTYSNGSFDNALPSGIPSGYRSGLITCDWGGYKGTEDYSTTGLTESQMYESGNQSRTKQNRVRCVRKHE